MNIFTLQTAKDMSWPGFYLHPVKSHRVQSQKTAGGHPQSKNVCYSEISSLFPYSYPLKLVHKWEIYCHSGLCQSNHKFCDWHLCKMLIDKFLGYLSTLSSPYRHHSTTISHHTSIHISFQIIHLYMWAI